MKEKQLESEEYFSYLGSLVTSDAMCKRDVKFRIAMVKAEINKEVFFFTSVLDLNLREETGKLSPFGA